MTIIKNYPNRGLTSPKISLGFTKVPDNKGFGTKRVPAPFHACPCKDQSWPGSL